jgi:hypothetical protein
MPIRLRKTVRETMKTRLHRCLMRMRRSIALDASLISCVDSDGLVASVLIRLEGSAALEQVEGTSFPLSLEPMYTS